MKSACLTILTLLLVTQAQAFFMEGTSDSSEGLSVAMERMSANAKLECAKQSQLPVQNSETQCYGALSHFFCKAEFVCTDLAFTVFSAEQCYGLWSIGPEAGEFEVELQQLADVKCETGAVRVSEIDAITTYKGPRACTKGTAQYKCSVR